MKQVYFDESGNTGQNLVDLADPIFVLASCSFDAQQESEVLSCFSNYKGPEIKFSRLRKTPIGQRAVLDFLKSDPVTSKTMAAVVFHKPYMIVTKYCDLVLEPSFKRAGINFYARGANIATANLLTTTMPVFLNPATWSSFLSSFVKVVREKSGSALNDWKRSAEIIFAHLEHTEPQMASFIAPVLLLSDADELFQTVSDNELDPIVPSYHFLANHWSRHVGERYKLIADASKELEKEKDRLLALSDPALKPISVGYDRRKTEYPLKISEITIIPDSAMYLQVQFADVLGGAIANAAKTRTKSSLIPGTFAHEVFTVCFAKGLILDAVWPNHEIDPKDLGTDLELEPESEGIDPATYAGMILAGHPSTRQVAP